MADQVYVIAPAAFLAMVVHIEQIVVRQYGS